MLPAPLYPADFFSALETECPPIRGLRNGEALTDHVIVLELREVTDQEVSVRI